MGLARLWVTTGNGEYLVLSGRDVEIAELHESRRTVARRGTSRNWLLRLARRYLGDPGRVEVRWRDETWAWQTATEREAYVAALRIEDLLKAGTWVPGRTPQPRVKGATPVEVWV
jgi:hypothetical protein